MLLWLAAFLPAAFCPLLACQDPSGAAGQTLFGTVIGQRKYEIRIQSGAEEFTIEITPRTTVSQRIQRPEFDPEAGLVRIGLQSVPPHPQAVASIEAPLPSPLFIRAWFASEAEMERCWDSDAVRRLTRYELFGEPPPGLVPLNRQTRELVGLVDSIDSRGIAAIDCGTEQLRAHLQDRDARIAGRNVADLIPLVTGVEAEVVPSGDGDWEARAIVFSRWPDPLVTEDPALPRCLWLGDEVSIAMFSALREKLAGRMNLQRPQENCGSVRNAPRMGAWLGPWREASRGWDVIVFNAGLHDRTATDAEYAQGLEEWIARLQPVGARLVWLRSVRRMPDDAVQPDLDRLNRVADEVLARHPAITVCDPGRGLSPDSMDDLKPHEWWDHAAARIAAAVLDELAIQPVRGND